MIPGESRRALWFSSDVISQDIGDSTASKPDRPAWLERPATTNRYRPAQAPSDLPADTYVRTVSTAGTIARNSITYRVDVHRAFQQLLVASDGDKIIAADLDGEMLVTHARPAPA